MGVINKAGDTLSNVGRGVVDKVKASTDLNKLKQQIVYEQQKISESFEEIGRNYYKEKPVHVAPENVKLFGDIDSRLQRIERLKVQMNELKGIKVCTECGATITNNFLFCGICGARLPVSQPEPLNESTSDTVLQNSDALAFAK